MKKAHEVIKELKKEAYDIYSFFSYVNGSIEEKESELKNINKLIGLVEKIRKAKKILAGIGIHSSISISIDECGKDIDTYIKIEIEDDFFISIEMNGNMSNRVAKKGTNTLHAVLSVLKQRKEAIETSIARLNSYVNI